MLLSELVELLADHFNILNDDITAILKNNNIRIGQRLLLEKKDNNVIETEQTKNVAVSKPKTDKVEKQVITAKVEEKLEEKKRKEKKEEKLEEKIEEKKEEKESKPVRGRGRPRKNMVMKEEEYEEICVEVEEVDVGGVKYYKTSENVILSKALEIEGIMRDGKLVRSNK